MEHDCGALEPGRDLREQFKPRASHVGFHAAEAGGVPVRVVEPLDEAAGDRVTRAREDDWDRPSLSLDGKGRRSPVCHDDVGLQTDQFLRERSYPTVVKAPTKVDPHG